MGRQEHRRLISCAILEQAGTWRTIVAVVLLVLIISPPLPLLWRGALGAPSFVVGRAFHEALWNSVAVAALSGAMVFAIGWPIGVLAALYQFTGRQLLLALLTLPTIVPSFLWAIGWSALAARLGPIFTRALSAYLGSVLVFVAGLLPLVVLCSYAATRALTGSQIDAARLAGGERTVIRYALRHAGIPTVLVASLAAVLTVSDPGPGLIFGHRTAAAEILTSFSSLYDFDLAARQCVVLTIAVLVVAAPLAAVAAPRLSMALLAKQSRGASRSRDTTIGRSITVVMGVLVLLIMAAPVTGLFLPLWNDTQFARAIGELHRTLLNTTVYAVGSGVIAAGLALFLAFVVGHSNRLRVFAVTVCFVFFAVPPALLSLGMIQLGTAAPAWTDVLLRSRFTVCVALGLRFFPVAALLALRSWQSMAPSWSWAAALHGVPLQRYLRKVALPFMLPSLLFSVLLASLLATADVSTVLLLHPPGAASFPLAIFTVMANAPESLVASLCLLLVAAAALLLSVAWMFAARSKP